MGKVAWLAANAVFLLLFVLGAVLQYNDPDPIRWAVIYVAAAAVCGLEMAGRASRTASLVVAAVALVWAATLAPTALAANVTFYELYADIQMKRAGVEEAREALGLAIIAGWMVATGVAAHRRKRAAASATGLASAGERHTHAMR